MIVLLGRTKFAARLQFWTLVLLALCVLIICSDTGLAQQPPPQPGDAFATRFSGTADFQGPDGTAQQVIDVNGVVGGLIGITTPRHPPSGHHWPNEAQGIPITAGQVGQVFGVAIDNETSPNIFLSATSAFGLHLTLDKSDWMAGMWGEGGAGGIYRLNPDADYQPELFSIVALDGRPNSGASLGNIAYDRWNKQLYVSDLETGMIHRIDASNGVDAGHFDHGVQARQGFFDVPSGAPLSLQPTPFDPNSTPNYDACPGDDFTKEPACWNVADFRRRVWGLGVTRDPESEKVRLFYAVWGSQSYGNPEWDTAGDDQRNSIWSVGIDENGAFVTADVRREFLIPGFFAVLEDYQRAGGGHPVSDIAFSSSGGILLAERGGLRNLGLGQEEAFAFPHESRVLRYQKNASGVWEIVGRDDVGFYDRKDDNPSYLRANSAGGVDYGFSYTDNWLADLGSPDDFVWISGDNLCSPQGPCYDPASNSLTEKYNVSGLQGGPADITGEVAPEAAMKAPYPEPGPATPPTGPLSSYMIDLSQNIDEKGQPVPEEYARNDATHSGDVEVYKPGVGAPLQQGLIHLPIGSQPGVAPPSYNHFPPGSTHWPPGTKHWPPGSYHWPVGSGHWPKGSGHWPKGSGHWPKGSKHLGTPSIHWPPGSFIHQGIPSIHWPPGSVHKGKPSLHFPPGSLHKGKPSFHFPPGSFHKNKPSLHYPPGSVHIGKPSLHFPKGSYHKGKPSLHWPVGSIIHKGKPSFHWPPGSFHKGKPSIHFPPGSKVHIGKPSLHFPKGSYHKGKPSLHFPPGSKVHLPPGSKIHLPPGSKVHIGKPSLHYPPGSKVVHKPIGSKVHIGKPSVHYPPGSKVHIGKPSIHFPPGSKVHTPPGSKVHIGKPSLHYPPGSKVVHKPIGSKVHIGKPSIHYPPGSKVHIGKPSIHFPPGSKVHTPPGSKVHIGKPSLHFPPGSKVHTPPGSKVHIGKPSLHYPPGSKVVHKPIGSKVHIGKPSVHYPPGSKVHIGKPSIHFPPGSKVHTPPGSKVHKGKPSLHFPPGSKVTHKPVGSKVHIGKPSLHFPPGSKLHTPPGSKVTHKPPGSQVHKVPWSPHYPPGSNVHKAKASKGIHKPAGSKVTHKPVGSKVHFPTGSKVHTPPGSKVHLPPGSKVHLPPGSKSPPPIFKQPIPGKPGTTRPNKKLYDPKQSGKTTTKKKSSNKTPTCSGGRYWDKSKKACRCPSSKPLWSKKYSRCKAQYQTGPSKPKPSTSKSSNKKSDSNIQSNSKNDNKKN